MSPVRGVRFWTRVYEAALLVLPSSARSERTDIAAALEDQLRAAPGKTSAAGALLRAFTRLPGVLVVEWVDAFRRSRRTNGPGPRGVLTQNLRFAARTLRKNPTFTWASVLLIGLGVGAVTAVFTVVDHLLFRPLPYPDQERIHFLTNGAHNGPTLRALQDAESFDLLTIARVDQANLTRANAEPLRVATVEVTPSFASMYGARPALGRMLVEGDLTDRSVAVLTHQAWISIWGGDPAVVGSTIQLNAEPVTVVGVLESSFVIPERQIGKGAQILRPMNWDDPRLQSPGYASHSVVARVAPGVELPTAQAEMDRLRTSLMDQELLSTRRVSTWPLVPLQELTVRPARNGLLLLLGSVGLLLLVACANVALLFMARGVSRVREMSVRRALGAGRRILLGQLATESLLVGFAGGLLGIALARLSLAGFDRWIDDLPRADTIALDARVLLFTIALSTATALFFGLVPALRSLRQDVSSELRESGRTSTDSRGIRWLRSGLVVGEVGVSLVLVTLAGLLLRSFFAVTSQDPGVEPDDVWMIALNTPDLEANDAPDVAVQYRQRMGAVLATLEEVPGVSSAAYGIEMPFENVGGNTCCWSLRSAPMDVVDFRGDERSLTTYLHPVSDRFFETLGTGLLVGTPWTSADAESSPLPAVLTESLAIRHFGSAEAALGQELQVWQLDDANGPVRIVGVAEPTLHYGPDQPQPDAMYLPIEGLPFGNDAASFAVRAPGLPAVTVVGALRDAIWSVEPNLPVPSIVPLERLIDDASLTRRLSSALSSAFGAIALLLAAGGLYGTLLYSASQRRRELGIRIALGAGRARIQSDVVAGGVGLAVLGLLLGVPAVLLSGRVVESLLWSVAPTDPVAIVAASLVLLTTAALASWLPAYRASRTDPLEVLRAD